MEVAGRAFVVNIAAMERAGFETRQIVREVGVDLDAARRPGFRGSWESYLGLLERFYALHGADGFLRAARAQISIVPETRAIAGLLVSPRQLLPFLMRRAESMFLTIETAASVSETPEIQEWIVRIRPEHQASLPFMIGTRAVLCAFPTFLDLPEAVVQPDYTARETRFRVRLPSPTNLSRSHEMLRAMVPADALLGAIDAGERSVRDLYDRLRSPDGDSQRTATHARGRPGPPDRPWGLTERQFEVATWLVQGRSNKRIAESLACSARTVEAHVAAIMRKADVGSRAELVARWHVVMSR